MTLSPRKIRLLHPSRVSVTWSDGSETSYSPAFLRNNCPCATCTGHGEKAAPRFPAEDESSLPILGQEPLRLTAAQQVGHYAIQFSFSDGHQSGIYSYEYLLRLADYQKEGTASDG